MQWFIICTYKHFTNGLERNLTYKNRLELMRSIAKMISYHNRYEKPPVNEKTISKYLVRYRSASRSGMNVGNVFKTISTNTRLSYVAMLQQKFPEFLHTLFCYASKTLGLNATVPQIVQCMNTQAVIRHPHCAIRGQLQMTVYKFWNFFYSNGGKLKVATEKPTLTLKNKLQGCFLLKNGAVFFVLPSNTISPFWMRSGSIHIAGG